MQRSGKRTWGPQCMVCSFACPIYFNWSHGVQVPDKNEIKCENMIQTLKDMFYCDVQDWYNVNAIKLL